MNLIFKKLGLLAICTLLFFKVQAQGSVSPLEDMANAIRNSHVSDMVKYFDNFVPITINNAQTVYSRTQAELVLRDFFEKNPSKDFTVMDNGAPDANSKFMIGSLTDNKDTKYSVYILLRYKDGRYLLLDLRLNKDL